MKKNSIAIAALIICPTFAIADEAGDVKACADAFLDAAGESVHDLAASWEPFLFSPNRVDFPKAGVICDIGGSGVVNLSKGSTIFIQDSWPIGREPFFLNLQERIEAEKERLQAKLRALDETEDAAETQLRVYSNNPEEIINGARREITDILEIDRTAPVENAGLRMSELTHQIQSCQTKQETAHFDLKKCQGQIKKIESAEAQEQAYRRFIEFAKKGAFGEAKSIWKQTLSQSELSPEQLRELEAVVLEGVRPIPVRETQVNKDGYTLLSEINPSEATYKMKLEEYSTVLAEQEQAIEKRICRSLILFLGSLARPENIRVQEANNFPNPRGWRSVFVAEYIRPSDGKRWRYLCGVGEEKINWSMIESNGGPGRRWHQSQPDPSLKYRVDDGGVIFFETYSDGTTSEKKLPL